MRVFGPLPKTHPLVSGEDKAHSHCPVCSERFKEGDYLILVPVQAHGSEGPNDHVVMSMPVHRDCYWPKQEEGGD